MSYFLAILIIILIFHAAFVFESLFSLVSLYSLFIRSSRKSSLLAFPSFTISCKRKCIFYRRFHSILVCVILFNCSIKFQNFSIISFTDLDMYQITSKIEAKNKNKVKYSLQSDMKNGLFSSFFLQKLLFLIASQVQMSKPDLHVILIGPFSTSEKSFTQFLYMKYQA